MVHHMGGKEGEQEQEMREVKREKRVPGHFLYFWMLFLSPAAS